MTNLEKFRAHTELADQLLQASTHQQLAEALQILALNLAAYKVKFGEISQPEILETLRTGAIDEGMAAVLADSMAQLCGVLRSVAIVDQPGKLN